MKPPAWAVDRYLSEIGKVNDPTYREAAEKAKQTDVPLWQVVVHLLIHPKAAWTGFKTGIQVAKLR